METIERFLSDDNLERLASKPTYERGCEYSQHLHVVRLRRRKTAINATVEGREDYEVSLRDEGAQLGFSCTCPVGQQKKFCKHAVATALTWMRERRSFERDRPPRRTVIRIADVRSHLMTLEKAELVERLLTLAATSPERLDEMKLDTAWRGPGGPDIPALKHAVRTWMWGSNNGQPMGIRPQAVPRVELILSIIRSLIRDGRYDDAIILLDNVFRTAPVCSWLTFDYDGEGGHKDLLNTFQELHYDACRRGHLPVEKLAHDLLDYEIELDVALFANALRRYSPLLGKKGIGHYIRALEELARAAKPLKPAAVWSAGDRTHRRRRLFRLVANLDLPLPPEWYADVMGRDLSEPEAFHIIASKFLAAGRFEETVHWVERGLSECQLFTDSRLLGLGVEVCRSQGWMARAAAMVAAEFKRRPSIENFRVLREVGMETGKWSSLRRQAFRVARALIRQRRRPGSEADLDFFGTRRDVSRLVDMYLADDNLDAARRTARRGYCRDALWVQIAERLMETDPEESATLFELRIQQLLLDQKPQDDVSTECAKLIAQLKSSREKTGQEQRFMEWIENLRISHSGNPALLKSLDSIGYVR